MSADATHRPLKIPVKNQNYAEEHSVFDLMGEMLESLLVSRPDDPLKFLIEHLESDTCRRVNVAVIGPPGAGKTSVAQTVAQETESTLVSDFDELIASRAGKISAERGFVFDGFPTTREQSLTLQESGFKIDYLFLLTGPRQLMKQRQDGKREDPETGKLYHPVLNWPSEPQVLERLREIGKLSSFDSEYAEFERNRDIVIKSHHPSIVQRINSDQPLVDVTERVVAIVRQKAQSEARFILKGLILGPTGAGKRTVAMKLARKWNVVPVNVQELIQRNGAHNRANNCANLNKLAVAHSAPEKFFLF